MVPIGQPPGAAHDEPSFIGSVGLHATGAGMSLTCTARSGTAMSPAPPCAASSLPQPATAIPARSARPSQEVRMAAIVLQIAGQLQPGVYRREGRGAGRYIDELASAAAVAFHLRSVSHCAVRWKSAKRVILPTAPRKTMATSCGCAAAMRTAIARQ